MTSHDQLISPNAENVAASVHALFPYAEERSFVAALELGGMGDLAQLREEGARVPGMSPEALEGLLAYVQFTQAADPSEAHQLHRARTELAAEGVTKLQRFLSAILLDASLAFIEGQELPTLTSDEDLAQTLEETARTRVNPRVSRRIPFGAYSDDTQFLLSGVIGAAMNEPTGFAMSLVHRWRSWGQKGIWRGTGRRMKAFLNGDPKGFSGSPTLGDVLRLAPFLALPAGTARSGALHQLAGHLSLTKPQVALFFGLSDVHDAVAAGHPSSARTRLRDLAAELRTMDPTGSAHSFMVRVLMDMERELLDGSSITGFLGRVGQYSSDWDTLGFIAGLFHPAPMQALRRTCRLLRHLEHRDSILALLLAASVPSHVVDLSNTLTGAAWALTDHATGR